MQQHVTHRALTAHDFDFGIGPHLEFVGGIAHQPLQILLRERNDHPHRVPLFPLHFRARVDFFDSAGEMLRRVRGQYERHFQLRVGILLPQLLEVFDNVPHLGFGQINFQFPIARGIGDLHEPLTLLHFSVFDQLPHLPSHDPTVNRTGNCQFRFFLVKQPTLLLQADPLFVELGELSRQLLQFHGVTIRVFGEHLPLPVGRGNLLKQPLVLTIELGNLRLEIDAPHFGQEIALFDVLTMHHGDFNHLAIDSRKHVTANFGKQLSVGHHRKVIRHRTERDHRRANQKACRNRLGKISRGHQDPRLTQQAPQRQQEQPFKFLGIGQCRRAVAAHHVDPLEHPVGRTAIDQLFDNNRPQNVLGLLIALSFGRIVEFLVRFA